MSDHECYACKYGAGAATIHEMELVEKYGWFSHFVAGDKRYPFGINVHTHELKRKFEHDDLQIILPVPDETLNSLLWTVVERIEKGEKFEPGMIVSKVVKNYNITFAYATENGRLVLRLILPDKDCNLKEEDMDPKYALQWRGTL